MKLSARAVRLMQSDYEHLYRSRNAASKLFYATLFEIAPEARALFRGSMAAQRRQFMAALGFLIMELEKPEVILPAVKSLARRHVRYGVLPQHYEPVGAALSLTFEKTIGDRFTEEHRQAWRDVYGQLSSVMIAEAYPGHLA